MEFIRAVKIYIFLVFQVCAKETVEKPRTWVGARKFIICIELIRKIFIVQCTMSLKLIVSDIPVFKNPNYEYKKKLLTASLLWVAQN